MTRMTGPDCVVMCNLINTHTHTHTHTHRETGETWVESGKNVEKKGLVQQLPTRRTWGATRKQGGEHKVLRAQVRFVQVERVCPLCRV